MIMRSMQLVDKNVEVVVVVVSNGRLCDLREMLVAHCDSAKFYPLD